MKEKQPTTTANNEQIARKTYVLPSEGTTKVAKNDTPATDKDKKQLKNQYSTPF